MRASGVTRVCIGGKVQSVLCRALKAGVEVSRVCRWGNCQDKEGQST